MRALAVFISESAGFCSAGIEGNPSRIYKIHVLFRASLSEMILWACLSSH